MEMPSSKSCTSIIEDTVYGYSDHLEFFQDRKDQLNAMREKVTKNIKLISIICTS